MNKSCVACFEAACYISCTEIHEREICFLVGHFFTSVYNINHFFVIGLDVSTGSYFKCICFPVNTRLSLLGFSQKFIFKNYTAQHSTLTERPVYLTFELSERWLCK